MEDNSALSVDVRQSTQDVHRGIGTPLFMAEFAPVLLIA
jgi:hypothetical protein